MNETPDPNAQPGAGPMGYQPPPPPSGPMGYTPPPAAPKKNNKLGLIILGIVGLVVVGGVAYAALTRDSSVGSADALQVGDCIDRPDETEAITEIQHRPCNTPHDGEVFHNFTSPAGPDEPYPVISGFGDLMRENCLPAFEAYTGRDWQTDTELDYTGLTPTLSGWTGENHDRDFTCYLVRIDEGKLYGSLKNLGASPLPTQAP